MTVQPLAGRLALVTGASRGSGAATAVALGAAGAHVVLTARTAKGLEEVEQTIFDAGGSATISTAPSLNSIDAAVGQKCESETNVPRRSWTDTRGKCRHVVGRCGSPRSRWTMQRFAVLS